MEKRFITATVPTATGRRVNGHAAKFNSRSRPLPDGRGGTFVEIILPGAFPPLEKQDVRALWNHDPKQLLARSKFGQGTLKLSIDGVGLRYEFDAPNNTFGNDLLESIKRGDLDESSFSFTLEEGGDEWTKENGVRIRRIKRIAALHDISPVTEAAYGDATVSARSKPRPGEHPSITAARRRLNLIAKI